MDEDSEVELRFNDVPSDPSPTPTPPCGLDEEDFAVSDPPWSPTQPSMGPPGLKTPSPLQFDLETDAPSPPSLGTKPAKPVELPTDEGDYWRAMVEEDRQALITRELSELEVLPPPARPPTLPRSRGGLMLFGKRLSLKPK